MFGMKSTLTIWAIILLVFAIGVLASLAGAATFPTWRFNAVSTGAATFYETAPWDQVAAGPSLIQVAANADTVRVSFHYYTGSAWVAMNGKVAYGDTNILIGPGETATFNFTYPKPDLVYVTTDGTARVLAE